ncbi:MAG TPA: allantoate amidohydrolase [Candidatus Sulfotelmatobacter sp.]|nr:allantoate amidohydrolase [Candidatus Sulfotelmatobacter sp.]
MSPLKSRNELRKLTTEVISRCQELATFSEDPGGLKRTFLSPPMRGVHKEITSWLRPLGAETRVDAAGNLRAIYRAEDPDAPRLLIGSHLDTVPNAGAFDGILGVVIAIALLAALKGRRLPYAIEVVGFSEEEGVRFGTPFIGSRALVGTLDERLLGVQDSNGVTVRRAIEEFGLDPTEIPAAALDDDVFSYLEFHIEQGPVLEKLALPLGVVEAIAGQSRFEFSFVGRANHAGTTPMDQRSDAMAGAARWIGEVERLAKKTPGLVATVGSVKTLPGAVNVISGEALATLDVRHGEDEARLRAVGEITEAAQDIAKARGLAAISIETMNQPAVVMDRVLTGHIEESIRRAGCEPHRMTSGAGHDAMILAQKVPVGMVFLRTPGGVSHHPSESVLLDDVERALQCGLHLLDRLALSTHSKKRTNRA